MASLIKLKPTIIPAVRSTLTICSKTFTSHAQMRTQSLLATALTCKSARRTVLQDNHCSAYQIRPYFTRVVKEDNAAAIIGIEDAENRSTQAKKLDQPSQCNRATIAAAPAASDLKWELIPIETSTPVITGAILPFAQLNFLQKLVFPYTYALMYYLDYLAGIMPWWAAIMTTTATSRLIFFPLVLKQNIIGIKTNNVLPETQKIQKRLNETLAAGDNYGHALARTKLQLLFKEHGITIKDRLLPIALQAPLYMSFFFLLRKLTGVPVEGLTTGGILWFTDLTAADPYFILPTITAGSMFILMEFGMEGGANPALMTPVMKLFMRVIPVGIFAAACNFPAATLLFWSTSNLFTLGYAMIMKSKWFKKAFKIPPRRQIDPSELPLTNMTFKGQIQAAVEKSKSSKTSMDVRRLDDIAFRKAGIGPLRKTYKEPPKAKT